GYIRCGSLCHARFVGDILMRDLFRTTCGTFISCGFLWGCDTASLEVLTPNPDGGVEAAPPDASEAEATTCSPVGIRCGSSGDCCSGLCALDSFSERTCRPTTGCL